MPQFVPRPPAGRDAEIIGLPPTLRTLRIFRTSSADHCRELPGVKVEAGRARLLLPAQSLTTLTNTEP